jgi:hypothetical protein
MVDIEILYIQRQRSDGYKYHIMGRVLRVDRQLPILFNIIANVQDRSCKGEDLSSVECLDRWYNDIIDIVVKLIEQTNCGTSGITMPTYHRSRGVPDKEGALADHLASEYMLTPDPFTGPISTAKKRDGCRYWTVEGTKGLWVYIKNLGRWNPNRSIVLESDQLSYIVAEYGSSGYAGLFRPATPKELEFGSSIATPISPQPYKPIVDTFHGRKPSKGCTFRPLRKIGVLRNISNPHSQDFIRHILRLPPHTVCAADVDYVSAQEADKSSPLGRYRYIKKETNAC